MNKPSRAPGSEAWRGIPRLRLTSTPTPLDRLAGLSAATGVEVLVKRDDAGPLGLAGNKVRKLEFILPAALRDRIDTVVSIGGPQSNSTRALAAAAAQLGLECHLVHEGPASTPIDGNLLLSRLFGAHLHFADTTDLDALAEVADSLVGRLTDSGRRVLMLPLGVSTPLSVLGAVAAYEELISQLDRLGVVAERLYHASGSGGTHAGFLIGQRLHPGGPMVHGVDVGALDRDAANTAVLNLAQAAARLIPEAPSIGEEGINLDFTHIGDGYGVPTVAALQAITTTARVDGVLTDPVYTGKALAAMLADLHMRMFEGPVVFWHTGGLPACLSTGYASALLEAAAWHAPQASPLS